MGTPGLPPKRQDSLSAEDDSVDPGWAPSAPSDGRDRYQWESRWPEPARKQMRCEAAALIATAAIGLGAVYVGVFRVEATSSTFSFGAFLLAAFGAGMLGGTTFAVKWFYHVVARGLWHVDRRYWRLFVPYASALLSVVTALAVLGSDVATGKDPRSNQIVKTLLIAFLSGYFSDAASAKLADVAKVVFGVTETHKVGAKGKDSDNSKPNLGG